MAKIAQVLFLLFLKHLKTTLEFTYFHFPEQSGTRDKVCN